jgi:uncharacterized protein
MILLDANVLLYAAVDQYPQHRAANDWLNTQMAEEQRIGLPWPTILAFLRISTNPRALAPPMAMGAAWAVIDALLAQPNVWIPVPTEKHASVLSSLFAQARTSGNLVMDAHIAALATEHGLTVFSSDADFAKFRNVRWVDPLAV